MENRETRAEKAEWRKRWKAVRDGLPEADRKRRSERLRDVLERDLLSPLRSELGRPLRLCAYAPYRSEASPFPLLQACWAAGDRVFAPRMKPGEEGLELREVHALSDWSPGKWGVPEPDPGTAPLMDETTALDVILVPGMAFGPSGTRLGYGGGYYDRLYEERRKAKRPEGGELWIGFAYAVQVAEEGQLPAEDHDLRLDGLATDERFVRFG